MTVVLFCHKCPFTPPKLESKLARDFASGGTLMLLLLWSLVAWFEKSEQIFQESPASLQMRSDFRDVAADEVDLVADPMKNLDQSNQKYDKQDVPITTTTNVVTMKKIFICKNPAIYLFLF